MDAPLIDRRIRLAEVTADPVDETALLRLGERSEAGAATLFVGRVRDHDPQAAGKVVGLDYTAHPGAPDRLVEIITAATPVAIQRNGHPAKRVFQALRIEVNQELVVLERAIPAALDLLGADFRFETRVLLHDGALHVVGEGDPTLDEPALRELAAAIAGAVDPAVLRKIVVDDLAFSPRTLAPGFSDEGVGEAYQAPSGALSLDFNTVEITAVAPRGKLTPGEIVPLVVTLRPQSPHVVVDDQAIVGRGAVMVRSYAGMELAGQARTVVALTGKLRAGRTLVERRRVVDPGLYTGGALAVMLSEKTGIANLPVERGVAPPPTADVVWVARRESVPLQQIAGGALAWSNNFMAEQLLRTLGWRMTGEPGDWDNGARVVQAYWEALGLPAHTLVFENGSGFSQRGRVTTTALVDLIAVANRVSGGQGLLSALPVAGEEGTLRARLRRSGKRVRAKTGTMAGISGLSGVITAEDGTPQVAFSILSNVRDGGASAAARRKRAEDAIVTAVLEALDGWALERSKAGTAP